MSVCLAESVLDDDPLKYPFGDAYLEDNVPCILEAEVAGGAPRWGTDIGAYPANRVGSCRCPSDPASMITSLS